MGFLSNLLNIFKPENRAPRVLSFERDYVLYVAPSYILEKINEAYKRNDITKCEKEWLTDYIFKMLPNLFQSKCINEENIVDYIEFVYNVLKITDYNNKNTKNYSMRQIDFILNDIEHSSIQANLFLQFSTDCE